MTNQIQIPELNDQTLARLKELAKHHPEIAALLDERKKLREQYHEVLAETEVESEITGKKE